MRRASLLVLVVPLAAGLAACGYQPEIERPGAATGVTSPGPPPVATTGPVSTTPTFTAEGCPVDDEAFCEQAAFLANALVLSDADAVFDLGRRVTVDCADVVDGRFPQCDEEDRLTGYLVVDARGESFVDSPADHHRTLDFLVEAVDEEYSDELGGAPMQVLGVSTCGEGSDTSYHVVYLVGLGDPTSTVPGDRFLGSYELTRQRGRWAIDVVYVGLFTDWQLVLDDPLNQIACGDVQPWVGAAPNLNPPRSESQPTPVPGGTGSS